MLCKAGSGVRACTAEGEKEEERLLMVAALERANAKKEAAGGTQTQLILHSISTAADGQRAIRDFFFEEAISFSKVESRTFRQLCEVMRRMPASTPFNLPQRADLAGPLLDEACEETDQLMHRSLEEKITFGFTLNVDGFTDAGRRSIYNGVISNISDSWYLRNQDVSSCEKTHAFTAAFVKETAELLPPHLPQNIVHVCLDGACCDCFIQVEQVMPGVYCTLCTCHTFDLCIEDACDWSKSSTRDAFSWLNETVQCGILFLSWARSRPRLIGMLKAHTPLCLILPCDTRFGTNLIALERLLRLKIPLRQMLCSDEYQKYVSKLKRAAAKQKAQEWADKILSNEFWQRAERVVDVARLIFFELRVFDGKGNHEKEVPGTLEGVKESFRRLREKMGGLVCDAYLTEERRTQLCNLMKSRWNYHRRPAHEASAALSPRLRHQIDNDAITGLQEYLARFYTNVDEQLAALQEHAAWQLKPFEGLPESARGVFSGAMWWHQFGQPWPHLQKFACKILSQPASVSASERGFSAYSDVRTKKRPLSAARTDKLVRYYSNKRNTENTHLMREVFRGQELDADECDECSDEEFVDEEQPEDEDAPAGAAGPDVIEIID
eukprot:TRINITY_DN29642_c0_g1_i2.p1 TRINITY_DN29642_c0_g1~~TRINITY_DN29642_c0_g1_i2.p1  ORF type:complete len:610 (-),score=67.35 TRINITY_DN29642_c0_g1_i2:446-2275(-)